MRLFICVVNHNGVFVCTIMIQCHYYDVCLKLWPNNFHNSNNIVYTTIVFTDMAECQDDLSPEPCKLC